MFKQCNQISHEPFFDLFTKKLEKKLSKQGILSHLFIIMFHHKKEEKYSCPKIKNTDGVQIIVFSIRKRNKLFYKYFLVVFQKGCEGLSMGFKFVKYDENIIKMRVAKFYP